MYAAIAKPLYALLVVFEWNDKCDIAFEKLKAALVSAPILKARIGIRHSMFTLMHQTLR